MGISWLVNFVSSRQICRLLKCNIYYISFWGNLRVWGRLLQFLYFNAAIATTSNDGINHMPVIFFCAEMRNLSFRLCYHRNLIWMHSASFVKNEVNYLPVQKCTTCTYINATPKITKIFFRIHFYHLPIKPKFFQWIMCIYNLLFLNSAVTLMC